MTAAKFRAVILDLDGVVTRTAGLHARAWKTMFDEFLDTHGPEHDPFDIESDYRRYVDGKPRYEGAQSFLSSRGLDLPQGEEDDPPGAPTVCGLGNRKNELFRGLLRREGPETYPDAVEQLSAWREAGLKTALITSSRNGRAILDATGMTDCFDVCIDGLDAAEANIRGKPEPDVFLEAARRLGVDPGEAIIVEDAVSGVEAGRAGGFGLVVGVARHGDERMLREHGADVVVTDLREVRTDAAEEPAVADEPPERPTETSRHMSPWELAYREWKPSEQPLREALCALGNGHIVTRGAFEEMSAGGVHYPGTYVAGGYNRLESRVADRIIENEDLVNWPNWLPLSFRPEGGEWLDLERVEMLDFDFRLDFHRGVLVRTAHFRDAGGREFMLESRRLVHMAKPHFAALEWRLRSLNWSGMIEFRSTIDGSVTNGNVARYSDLANQHLDVLESGQEGDDGMYLTVQTNQSKIRMTQAARTRVFEEDDPAATTRERESDAGAVTQRIHVGCHQNKEIRIEKVVSIRTSFDAAISETQVAARKDIRNAGSFAELLESHETKWRHLWSISDIELQNGDVPTQAILRLHIFHLLQTTSVNTIRRDVGVPARGWHGEAYRGHIFWDELFIFPMLTLRIPEVTRSLLMYRFRRLDEARRLAEDAGFDGAMYPWQSGSDGREESQIVHLNPKSGRWLPDTTHRQRHVNAAIAYNVWEYYQATGDADFLAYHGAEMLLEIARFWSSIATFDADRGRYSIHGVVGPDEFHTDDPNSDQPGLSNNAYTNVMAAWVLCRASEVLDRLDGERRDKLREELNLRDEELARWDDISRKMFVPFREDGIISQFEGYDALKEFDWEPYHRQYGDVLRLDRILEAEGDDVNRYKASKQADVLMLFYLFSLDELTALFDRLGYAFDDDIRSRNIEYYMARTSHGSTLSQVVHSWVLARRDREKAWRFWQQGLHSDIEDIQGGTTSEGIHLGAMAGTVDLVYRGHTGLSMEGDVLWFDPQLPDEISSARLRLRYRGHWLTVSVTQTELIISFDRGRLPAAKIGFRGRITEMQQGETRTFAL